MTYGLRGFAVCLALSVGVLVCTEARAERDRHRSRHDDSAEEGDDSRESARERRRRRREEREAAKKAEEAAQAAPTGGAEGAAPAAAESPEGAAESADGEPDEGGSAAIYAVPGAEGRTLYTNAELATGEGPLDPMKLPPLATLSFETLEAQQLRVLDGRLAQAVDGLQAGDRCEALRGASRVPFRTWLWREHQRELAVGVGLFVLAMIAGFGWQSRTMRTILPMLPFAGVVYLGYDASNQSSALMDNITKGLRACSTALEEGDAGKPTVVEGHVEQVARMNEVINGAYEQRDKLVEKLMLEYRM
jgi:hypothetical protein